MNNIGKKLTIIIGSQVSGAVNGLDSVMRKVDALGSKMLRWGAVAAVAGITAGFAVAGNAVVKFGSQLEQTRLVYQTMLGSVEKGNAMLEKLDEFSNYTPFSGDQVNRAAKTLLAYGVSAGGLIPILRTVGDVSSGTGKDFNDLASIFGKVFAKGKMDSMALNQMVEAGVPILKTLQRMYDKTGSEIYAMAQAGKISAADMVKAFDQMTAAGGVYDNMMQKQSETTMGLWDAVTGQLEYAASLVGESLTPLFKRLLGIAVEFADKLVAMAKDGRILQYLAAVGMAGVDVAADLIKWFNRVYEYGAASFKTLQRVSTMIFEGLQAAIAGAFAAIASTAVKSVNAVINALNKITPAAMRISLVGEPEFVKQVAQWAKMSADNTRREFDALSSGADFKTAAANIDRKNSAVDKMAESINTMIGGELAAGLDELAKKRRDAATDLGPADDLASGPAGKNQDKSLKEETDAWAKLGLFTSGPADASVQLDQQRNNLLSAISGQVDSLAGNITAGISATMGSPLVSGVAAGISSVFSSTASQLAGLDNERNRLLKTIAGNTAQKNNPAEVLL